MMVWKPVIINRGNGPEKRDSLLFRSFVGTATFNLDPATLSSGLMRCVVRSQEEPTLERTLERPGKTIKIEKSDPVPTYREAKGRAGTGQT
jgi:hypothetical protein